MEINTFGDLIFMAVVCAAAGAVGYLLAGDLGVLLVILTGLVLFVREGD